MRILVVTNLYPNSLEPERAPFNRYLVRALAARHPVHVISPIAWTDELAARSRGSIPRERRVICDGIVVDHPRYWFTPKVMRYWYGYFFSAIDTEVVRSRLVRVSARSCARLVGLSRWLGGRRTWSPCRSARGHPSARL